MGLFVDFTGIIDRSEAEVINSLENYLNTINGKIETSVVSDDPYNLCVIQQSDGNTTIKYPAFFSKWDECSSFLSKELKAAVFCLHIYDGDFWAYTLFYDGVIKDQFMPIPDYFDENASQQEIDIWKGNAQIITDYLPYLKKENIEKYLIRWDLEQEEIKAYEDDEFTNCEDQLIDFMKKIKLPYPIDYDGNPLGEVFQFIIEEIPVTTITPSTNRPWWKFW